jgi:hypothetical protein
MRRGSIVAPLILIGIGILFLINNLHPELSVSALLARFWPFVLITWGALRLLEILYWAVRRKPLPAAGISGGEWTLIVLLSVFGSTMFMFQHRVNWPPFQMKMKGVEVFGSAFDYALDDKSVTAPNITRVVIENARGNARITGAEGNDVRVSGRKTVRAFHQNEADRIAEALPYEVAQQGETVYVRVGQIERRTNNYRDAVVNADLEISVPRGVAVSGRGRRGDFDITDVTGDVDIESDNAGVRLQNLGGNVRVDLRASDIIRVASAKGNVDLKGHGHDIELEDIEGQVVVSGSYAGDLQFRNVTKPIRFEGGTNNRTTEMRVESCPGQIRISRGNMRIEGVKGPVTIEAKSKDVQISDFTDALTMRLERGDVDVRPARTPMPKIEVTTDSGNIDLAIPENARFALKGRARRGDVENDFGEVLRVNNEGSDVTITGSVGDGPSVTLTSDRGAVRIRKGSSVDLAPLAPLPPKAPKPAKAVDSLVIEKH